MNETVGLIARVASIALFDWGLAYACGLLLAGHWLRGCGQDRVRVPRMVWAAVLMVVALCCQFYLLTATMVEPAGLSVVLRAMPSVATTHAGTMMLVSLVVACALVLAGIFLRDRWVAAASVGVILLLHAAMGHAAKDGNFSWAELLQFFHLLGMALWTGGVIVSGLVVCPRLFASGRQNDLAYVRSLSNVSTYSLGLVLLTGALKGWTGLDGHVGGLFSTNWGRILLLKLLFVGVAIALGFLHRRAVGDKRDWDLTETAAFLKTLRVEALCLTLVILISAWLGSVSPVGE